MSFNQVTLIGRLGADPEIRRTQDGRPIANFRMATSESWREKTTGEKKERTEWSRCVCFNEALSNVIEKYVKKGSQIMIQGQLQTRKWQDKDGVDRFSTEVVMGPYNSRLVLLDTEGGGGKYPPAAENQEEFGTTKTREPAGEKPRRPTEDMDDSIPF